MKNELQIFENPEFGKVRTIAINGEPWMVGKDVASALGYSNPRDALSKHVDSEDKNTVAIRDGIAGNPNQTIINESGLYALVLSSKLPGARKFRRWVTSEVLPSIRRTGGYNLPKDFPSALRALASTEEQRLALVAENEKQRQAIADFEPIQRYVNEILSSEGVVTVSQIAADYGLSAVCLNRILHDEGIQYCVHGQWLLYQEHKDKGYTKSETVLFRYKDNPSESRIFTRWTQKGRMLIHEILTRRGIQAVIDKKGA